MRSWEKTKAKEYDRRARWLQFLFERGTGATYYEIASRHGLSYGTVRSIVVDDWGGHDPARLYAYLKSIATATSSTNTLA